MTPPEPPSEAPWEDDDVTEITRGDKTVRLDDPDDRDRYEGELMAAGAVFMLLATTVDRKGTTGTIVTDADGNATNMIDVELPFLKSRYRITVTRAPEPT